MDSLENLIYLCRAGGLEGRKTNWCLNDCGLEGHYCHVRNVNTAIVPLRV